MKEYHIYEWIKAVNTFDPQTVSSLYGLSGLVTNNSESGRLIPTFKKAIYRGRDIKGYFTHFLEMKPRAEIIDIERIPLPIPFLSIEIGTYSFTLEDGEIVTAHFSMVWRFSLFRGWRLLLHHSSRLPSDQCVHCKC